MINVKRTFLLLLPLLTSGCAFLLPTKNLVFDETVSPPKYLRGVLHVHSVFSLDSRATLEKILEVAKDAQLDFVIITDHNTVAGKEAYMAVRRPTTPLLIFGNEITTTDGHLIALGVDETPDFSGNSQELVDWIHKRGGYAIIAHPFSRKRPWMNWELRNVDGIEVYNFGHALYAKNKFQLACTALALWPTPFVVNNIRLPNGVLEFWDSLLSKGRVAALGAADAHLKFADAPIMRGMFRRAISAVTLYVQSDGLYEKRILENLIHGDSFSVFEGLGSASNFSFEVIASPPSWHSGRVVKTNRTITLSVRAPNAEEIRLICNGQVVKHIQGEALKANHGEPGAYRVEVYRKKKLWIISNPIYVAKNELTF